jgi:hypothetical protein
MGIATALATMGVVGAMGSGCTTSSTTTGGDSGTVGSNDSGATGAADGPTSGGNDGQVVQDSGGGQDTYVPPPANLVIAHTAPGVPPFRVCFATGTGAALSVTAISALPDAPGGSPAYPTTGPYPGVAAGSPGIYPGTIGAFPTITDLSTLVITPFAILASSIANDINFDGGAGVNATDGGVEEDCVHLIGTHGLGTADTGGTSTPGRLTAGTDYFPLAAIPASMLLDNQTFLLTVNGCLPGGAPDPAAAAAGYSCGAGYDGGSTVNIGITQLDTTTKVDADGGNVGVQFAHRATAIENTPILYCADPPTCDTILPVHDPASAGVWPAFLQLETYDAGYLEDGGGPVNATGYVPLNVDPSAGALKYSDNTVTPATTATGGAAVVSGVNVAGVTNYPTMFGVFVQPLDGSAPNADPWPGVPGAPGDVIAVPLGDIFQFSRWDQSTASTPGGNQISAGQTYTFILVGDPTAQQVTLSDGGLNPAYDGRGVHILAFPNVFTPKVIQ